MEQFNPKDATPEQKKQISKILTKAKFRLFFIGTKFAVGLFSANLISFIVGHQILKDVDPDQVVGYQTAATFLNIIFMVVYLERQLKKNNLIVSTSIKEVLKK